MPSSWAMRTRHARAAREPERARGLQHGVTRQPRRLAQRVDSPGAALAAAAAAAGVGAGEQIARLERRGRVVDAGSSRSRAARPWPAGERRNRHGQAGDAEVAVGVAAGAAARQAGVGQRFEAQAGEALGLASRRSRCRWSARRSGPTPGSIRPAASARRTPLVAVASRGAERASRRARRRAPRPPTRAARSASSGVVSASSASSRLTSACAAVRVAQSAPASPDRASLRSSACRRRTTCVS